MNKKYHKEYELQGEGRNKRLVYHGPRYRLTLSPEEAVGKKCRLSATAVGIAGLFVAMAFCGNETTRRFYAGLPYAAMVVPVTYGVLDALRFWVQKSDMERVHYEGSFMHMFTSAYALLILSAAAGIGGTAYQIFANPGAKIKNPIELLFIPMAALIFMLAWLFIRQLRFFQGKIVKIEKDADANSSTDGAKFL